MHVKPGAAQHQHAVLATTNAGHSVDLGARHDDHTDAGELPRECVCQRLVSRMEGALGLALVHRLGQARSLAVVRMPHDERVDVVHLQSTQQCECTDTNHAVVVDDAPAPLPAVDSVVASFRLGDG